jgi:hypothetical protein
MTSSDESTDQQAGAPALRRAAARTRDRRRRSASRPARRLRPPSRTARRLIGFAVLPVALMAATFAVAGPSYSVFNRTTSNAANSWSAGTVTLQNNSSGTNAQIGSALFTVSGLQPGASASKCVAVTSTSSVTTGVSLYVSNVAPTGAGNLPSYVSMSVTIGTGSSGTNGDCTGYTPTSTLATNVHLDSLPTTYAGGLTPWAPTGGTDTRVFKFTYTVDMTVPNTLQNSTAGATLVWEAQSS